MEPRTRVGRTVLGLLLALGFATLPAATLASSHREAPLVANDPAADNTDVYFFVSPNDPNNVVIIGCWWPMEEAAGGPNFFHFSDNLDYAFYLDNDGDTQPDLSYTFRFTTQIQNLNTFLYATGPITSLDDPDWNYRQTYTVTRRLEGQGAGFVIANGLLVPPANVGPRTTPDYESLVSAAVYTITENGRDTMFFAGQRDDPFFVDLGGVFDLVGFRAIPGNQGQGVDGLGGYNCQTIAMEIPIAELTRDGSNPTDPADAAAVIGLWSATWRRVTGIPGPSSNPTEVSRLGMPLVNEVVIPLGMKDRWNRSFPQDDGQFLSYVTTPELPLAIQALYGIPAPPTPRCDLVTIFLTGIPGLNQPPGVVPSEQMRLNVAIKPDGTPDSRFGLLGGDLDGYPNGRRLADDVVDISERVVEGIVYPLLCDPDFVPHPLAGQLGDGVDVNDRPFLAEFPYVATPWQGWEHDHHRIEPPHDPERTETPAEIGAVPHRPADVAPAASARFSLDTGQPNPVEGRTQIRYSLAREEKVSLRVYDVAGRVVRTLVDQVLPAGDHATVWDGADEQGRRVPAGVYVYRLESAGESAERKLAVLR